VGQLDGDFHTVLDAARAGAPWAHERIFKMFSPMIAGYLRLRRAPEPEDLTSEVFMSVLRGLHRFDGDEDRFRAWLFTIVKRRLIDDQRRRARRPAVEPLEGRGPVAPDDVETTVQTTLATERVVAMCDRLTDDQRDVVLLRVLSDLTVTSVAAMLGKSPGAIKALQRRALRSIEGHIRREDPHR
jgi:RNA polymerase sigma factor (sigma-70 family)